MKTLTQRLLVSISCAALVALVIASPSCGKDDKSSDAAADASSESAGGDAAADKSADSGSDGLSDASDASDGGAQ